MIQANPTITTLRRAWMGVPIALAGIVVLIALLFATAILFNYSYSFSLIAYPFLILAGGIITLVITILQGRYWQRIEQRRFAAVQGEQTLLAAEQPTPNAASLQLPITIKLRYRKESLPLMQGAPIMIAMLHHALDKLSLQTFEPLSTTCLTCGKAAHIAYHTQRTVTTLTGQHRLHLAVRRCTSPDCPVNS